jgi:peptide/nickel transport system permease protein
MPQYVIRRFLLIIPVFILVSFLVYSLLLLLPGDPAVALLGENPDPERLEQIRRDLGLDRPIYVQYFEWFSRVIRGDFGHSIQTGEPVVEALKQRFPVTLQIGLTALLISLIISLPIGVYSGAKRNSVSDHIAMILAYFTAALPSFFLGILLILIFSISLRWLAPAGYVSPTEDLWLSIKSTIMPALTLGLGGSAVLVRQIRSSMVDELSQDYIRTARAKGLSEFTVLTRHALRNGLIPVVTVLGVQVGYLLGGAVIVETIFAVPGMGRLAVFAFFQRDLPMAQGVVLVTAAAMLVVNFVVDISYRYLDPRIQYR